MNASITNLSNSSKLHSYFCTAVVADFTSQYILKSSFSFHHWYFFGKETKKMKTTVDNGAMTTTVTIICFSIIYFSMVDTISMLNIDLTSLLLMWLSAYLFLFFSLCYHLTDVQIYSQRDLRSF